MGRRGGFVGILSAMARESARQQRLVEAAQRKRMREIERECREQERQNRLLAKEEKLRYLESRIEEAEELNLEMKENISELQGLLEVALKKNHTIEFSSLRINSNYESFKLPKNLSTKLPEPCREKFLRISSHLTGLLSYSLVQRKSMDIVVKLLNNRINARLKIIN